MLHFIHDIFMDFLFESFFMGPEVLNIKGISVLFPWDSYAIFMVFFREKPMKIRHQNLPKNLWKTCEFTMKNFAGFSWVLTLWETFSSFSRGINKSTTRHTREASDLVNAKGHAWEKPARRVEIWLFDILVEPATLKKRLLLQIDRRQKRAHFSL